MTVPPYKPARSDVWLADFGLEEIDEDGQSKFTRFREHGGKRPCVVLSNNEYNQSGSELVIVVPVTSVDKGWKTHVALDWPEGGLPRREGSFVICEGIRSIARQFLLKRYGRVEDRTMREITARLSQLILLS
jgi:mRNA interferase MazF